MNDTTRDILYLALFGAVVYFIIREVKASSATAAQINGNPATGDYTTTNQLPF